MKTNKNGAFIASDLSTDLSDWDEDSIRIAIVSDTHGSIHPEIVKLVAESDAAIHGGDICSSADLDALKPKSGLIFAVAGNNDVASKWVGDDVSIVESLPPRHSIVLSSGTISVEHGHTVRDTRRYHEILRSRYPDSRAIVYGHTHQRVIDQSEYPWMLNPGASGQSRNQGIASCLILEAGRNDWRVTEHRFPNLVFQRQHAV